MATAHFRRLQAPLLPARDADDLLFTETGTSSCPSPLQAIDSTLSGRKSRGPVSLMGLQAVYRAPRISDPHPEHRVYPYPLNDLAIELWCADITYIPVRRGFLYLVAVMNWASRHVLAWRLSNTLDAGFCTAALDEALARHGTRRGYSTPTRVASSPASLSAAA